MTHEEKYTSDNYTRLLDRDLTREHRSWIGKVAAFHDEEGEPFLPYLMKKHPFSLAPDVVNVTLDDGVVQIPRFDASVFWRSFEDGITFDRYQDMAQLNAFDTGVEYDFTTLQRVDRDEGQLKLMLNYVMSFVLLTPSKPLAVLIIGSQGDQGIGGLSFEPLAEWLSTLGYRGEFFLYDPNERKTQTYTVSSFMFHVFAEEYDYEHPKYAPDKFDVVLEDVYVPSMTSQAIPPQFQGEIVPIKKGRIPFGDSMYVLYRDNTNCVRARVWEGTRRTSKHKDHQLDPAAYRKILGGGHIKRTRDDCVIYGSSMTYGPVPRRTAEQIFIEADPRYEPVQHGREAFDPKWNILKHHERARISTKYYGERVPDVPYRVQDQYYYSGHEKRLLMRHPALEHKRVTCCTAHSVLDTVNAAMVCGTGADLRKAADILYGKVARKYCSPYVGVHLLAAKTRWLAASRMQQTKSEAENHIIRNLRISPTLANRALLILLKQKMVRIVKVKEHATMDDFSVPEMRKGKCVLWTEDAKYYFDPSTGTYYQSNGNLAQDVCVDQPIVRHSYLERISNGPLIPGASLFDIVRSLEASRVSWKRIYPYPLRGKGEAKVTIDRFGSDITVLTMAYINPIAKGYRLLGDLNGYRIYSRIPTQES